MSPRASPPKTVKPTAKPTAKPATQPAAQRRPKLAKAVQTDAPAAKFFRRKRAAPVARGLAAAVSADRLDQRERAVDEFTLTGLNPHTLIAPNFRVYELTQSELAARRGIANGFANDLHLRAAIHLARQVLQPVRHAFGAFTPNSVYRSQALERALKNKPATWLSTSQHAVGEACDFEIVGRPTLELAAWARDNLEDFDQIICECYDPRQGPNSGWVHVSLRLPGHGSNRRQCLSYVPDPASGRLVYVDGLQAMA